MTGLNYVTTNIPSFQSSIESNVKFYPGLIGMTTTKEYDYNARLERKRRG